MTNKHIGSNFDDFLKEEGIYDECKNEAMTILNDATPNHIQRMLKRQHKLYAMMERQRKEVYALAHKRPMPSNIGSMLCNMTERHEREIIEYMNNPKGV